MKHKEREWYTCDRCGAYIADIPSRLSLLQGKRKEMRKADFFTSTVTPKNYITDIKPVLPDVLDMDIVEYYESKKNHYHLCGKCRKDFEEWLKNGRNGN